MVGCMDSETTVGGSSEGAREGSRDGSMVTIPVGKLVGSVIGVEIGSRDDDSSSGFNWDSFVLAERERPD